MHIDFDVGKETFRGISISILYIWGHLQDSLFEGGLNFCGKYLPFSFGMKLHQLLTHSLTSFILFPLNPSPKHVNMLRTSL